MQLNVINPLLSKHCFLIPLQLMSMVEDLMKQMKILSDAKAELQYKVDTVCIIMSC